jgi:pterin-4a-carbinolamine dehydratase
MALLTSQEIDRNLASLGGWTRDGDAIKKQFTFKGFPEAVEFVSRLVPDAAVLHGNVVHVIDVAKQEGIVKFAINVERE